MALDGILSSFEFGALDLGLALLILAFGYLVGKTAKCMVLQAAEASGIRQKNRFGIQTAAEKLGFNVDFVFLGALAVKYVIYLVAIFLALRVLNVQVGMNTVFLPLISYAPNILGAAVLLIVGSAIVEIIADVVKYRIRDAIDEKSDESWPISISTPIAAAVRYFLYAIVFITAFLQLGIRAEGLLAFVLAVCIVFLAAVAALAVLSLKDHAPNFTAGMYLKRGKLLDDGDFMEFEGLGGKVEKITAFATVIRAKGRHYVIPNSKIAQGMFSVKKQR